VAPTALSTGRPGRRSGDDRAVPPAGSGPRSRLPRPATIARLALSVVLLTALWSVAGPGTWAALSGTTENTGNTFSAGTVTMTDNDSGAAMFTFANQKPGVTEDGCIKVNYTGSVSASAVKLYGTVSGTMAPYLGVTITRGTDSTPAFDNCAGFVPDATNYSGLGAGVLFSGTLSTFPTTYAAGLTDPLTPWSAASTASYKVTVQVVDTNAVQGLSSGATFTWEARS
jgi:hypothetical protein